MSTTLTDLFLNLIVSISLVFSLTLRKSATPSHKPQSVPSYALPNTPEPFIRFTPRLPQQLEINLIQLFSFPHTSKPRQDADPNRRSTPSETFLVHQRLFRSHQTLSRQTNFILPDTLFPPLPPPSPPPRTRLSGRLQGRLGQVGATDASSPHNLITLQLRSPRITL